MAGHRYWRIYITAANGHGYAQFSEIAMATSVGGASVLTGGTAIASASNDASSTPNKALDGNQSTVWCGGSTNPQWWGYDFGAGVTPDILEARITANSSDNTYSPSSFSMDWSDNGSAWTLAKHFTSAPWPSATAKSFSRTAVNVVSDPAGRRFWRVNATANDYGPNSYVGVGDLVMRAVAGGPTLIGQGTAIKSAELGGLTAANAFDGDVTTAWSGGATLPQWIGYDFGAGVTPLVVEIEISSDPAESTDGAHTKPSNFTIDYSSDGTTWTTASTYTGVHWSPGDVKTFAVSAPAAAAASGSQSFATFM